MSLLKLAEGSTPTTPSSGLASLFAKATGLFYSKDSNGTVRALFGTKNAIINGGMQVGQRGALTLGSSSPAGNAGYGKVDRWQAWATGTAVSAGTADQMTTANCGRTGYALKLAGVTLTGSGVVYVRHRVESINALRFKNQVASFAVRVYHDVGSSINYTIIIRKPTVLNNYTSTTVITTGSATAVATGTETLLTLENVSMGDCSYGIEIEIQAACGAITTKNFQYAEAQLEEGPAATTFEYVSYEQELQRCMRYYEVITFGQASMFQQCVNSSGGYGMVPFKVPKQSVPTVVFSATLWNTATSSSAGSVTPATYSTQSADYISFSTSGLSGLVAGDVSFGQCPGSPWTAASEL